MNYIFAAILGLHGLVHGLGFVGSWGLGTGVPVMSPTLIAGIDPDGALMRAIGLLWLLPVVGFGVAAVGLALGLPTKPVLIASTLLSLGLCITWWGDAKMGVAIDAAILIALISTSWVAQLRTS